MMPLEPDNNSKIRNLFKEDPYHWLFEKIEMFTDGMLSSYIEKYNKRLIRLTSKEIYDAIWGSIPFSEAEVLIIDSPLLQRLRRIRQLGMSDYVYIGSLYSRYYHTIGVVSIADSMTRIVNSRIEELERSGIIPTSGTDEERRERKEFFLCLVRLAAIFHDTGHFFYSHTTEKYFRDDINCIYRETIDTMMDDSTNKFGKADIALHELISCMIVNTMSVRALLQIYFDIYKEKNNRLTLPFSFEKCLEYISSLIIGVPTDREILPYSQIINGPIDADKCDYLSRDSHVTKVPAGVDISRLIHKISIIVKVEGINTSAVWNDYEFNTKAYLEIAVAESAERTIFQLCMAKNTMYGSIYYHQKVLTAETTFREILNTVFTLFPKDHEDFAKLLTHTDDFFGQYLLYYLDQKNAEHGQSEEVKKDIEKLISSIQDLFSRTLNKRVADVSFDNFIGNQTQKMSLYEMLTEPAKVEKLHTLVNNIIMEYCNIQDMFGTKISSHDVKLFVILQDPIAEDPAKIKVNIDLGNGKYRPFRGYGPLVSKEAGDRKIHFVTNQCDRDTMFIALESVLFRDENILLKDESSSCTKYRNNEIIEKKKVLFDKQYYIGKLSKLIPDEAIIGLIDQGQKKIKEIKEKYSQFDGPINKRISEKTILSFLKQFCGIRSVATDRYKILLQDILLLLENALFINRHEFLDSMEPLLTDIISQKSGDYYIYAIGGVGDSAVHLNYYMKNDLVDTLRNEGYKLIDIPNIEKWLDELDESAINEKSTLIFFDDGAFSGKQVQSIFQTYFGVEKQERATMDRDHVQELTKEQQRKLKKLSILILYVCMAKEKTSELKAILSAAPIELKNIEIRAWHDISTSLLAKLETNGLSKHVLYAIGEKLLEAVKPHWTEERRKCDALGYNDSQQVVITAWSVPTYTITAFWCKGEIEDNWVWEPLFERTPKE